MARPTTTREITGDLPERVFKPQGIPTAKLDRLALTLDGLEALRLADLEGLYQEEAARRMGVSRATFARILTQARRTLAEALVHGKAVEIGGGDVAERPAKRWPCPIHGGDQRRGRGCRCQRGGARKKASCRRKSRTRPGKE